MLMQLAKANTNERGKINGLKLVRDHSLFTNFLNKTFHLQRHHVRSSKTPHVYIATCQPSNKDLVANRAEISSLRAFQLSKFRMRKIAKKAER